jgi:predicted Rossmann fold flavoprotein
MPEARNHLMKKQDGKRVVVVGGGASGMTAAIAAARRGAAVTVLERMSRAGKKLLTTGNGRCNLTNRNLSVDRYHGGNPRFVRDCLDQFDVMRTLAFFGELGIEPETEPDGSVYPASGQASSVLDVLRYEMERLKVEVLCDTKISRIEKDRNGYRCLCSDSREYRADRVIIAAGGKSSPNLGSDGSGFRIAERLGHTIRRLFPALVQVCLDSPYLKRLAGVRIQGRAEARIDDAVRGWERGELLFTDYGISGIPAMQLSRIISEYAEYGKNAGIHLDLFPDISAGDLKALIERRIAHNSEKTLEMSFVGLLHKRLIPVVLREAGFHLLTSACGQMTGEDIDRIAAVLKNWRLRCTGVKSWMYSQVTAGGVEVSEVHSRTMESKVAAGVYFAGEVLDVDGDCGGYNLQWAWSSGYVAGENAAG